MKKPDPVQAADVLPPHDDDAEAGVLGCCLLGDAGALGDAVEALPDARAFFDLKHRVIWTAITGLYRDRKPVDTVTVKDALGGPQQLQEAGGLVFLAGLPDRVPSAANLSFYLEIVLGKFIRRRMLEVLTTSKEDVFDSQDSAAEICSRIERRVLEVGQISVRSREVWMREAVQMANENVLDRYQHGRKMQFGPLTGFNYLDNLVPGLAPGELFVIGARPGNGKTAFAMQLAENMSTAGHAVCVFSLEMTALALAMRQIFQKAPAELYKFMNGFMSNADIDKITSASARLAPLPIIINDCPDITVEALEARARRLHRDHGIKVFVIDYMQLLTSKQTRFANRYEEMAHISKRIKALAKDLQVPIICLAQLNRELEKEPNRKPRSSDLRDAGQIEQDADIVGLLYEPKVDDEDEKQTEFLKRAPVPPEWSDVEHWRSHLRRINLLLAKVRNGRSGVDCPLVFIRHWCRFVDAYTPHLDREFAQMAQAQAEPGPSRSSDERLAAKPLPSKRNGDHEEFDL